MNNQARKKDKRRKRRINDDQAVVLKAQTNDRRRKISLMIHQMKIKIRKRRNEMIQMTNNKNQKYQYRMEIKRFILRKKIRNLRCNERLLC